MSRFATVYSFPTAAGRGSQSSAQPRAQARALSGPISRAEIDAAVVRGRLLQGEALRSGFRRAMAYLTGTMLLGGCLRALRPQAGVTAERQPCGCL